MELLKDVKIGSDPELFIFDPVENKFVCAIGRVGGTKDMPMSMGKDGFFCQEDNALVEFNIPPASTRDEFREAILEGIQRLQGKIPLGTLLKAQASAVFTPDQLTHPLANQFGCDPDYNAWTGRKNRVPRSPSDGLRTSGGHIHVGYNLSDTTISKEDVNENIIRWMDYYLGVPSILLDQDKKRRTLYGKAGAFRHKPYGVEYRTLSSFWLAKESTIEWAFDQTQKALNRADIADFIEDSVGDEIKEIINTGDEAKAMSFVMRHKLTMP